VEITEIKTKIEPLQGIDCPEHELLLCCARKHIDAETAAQIRNLLNYKLDWQYLFHIADLHAATPLLYWNLKTICPKKIPAELLQVLQEFFHFNSQRNMIFVRELIRLMQLFANCNIPVIPYKGVMLAASAYGNLALRQMTDLDLLVQEKDLSRTMDLLRDQGYELTFQLPWEYHFTKSDSLHNIDLHCPMFSEVVFAFPDPELVWQNLESFSLAGAALPNLTSEMALLIVSLNANKDGWDRLGQVSDVAALVDVSPHLDWEKFIRQQTTLGSKRIVFLGLFLAKTLLDAKIPPEVWEQIQSDPVVSNLASQVISRLFSKAPIVELDKFIFQIKVRERFQDRLKLFWKWMQPHKIDHELFPLPKSLSFLYYLIRPIRLLSKHGLHNAMKLGLRIR
jgi:Uncharacterised nucleotidyltransferase